MNTNNHETYRYNASNPDADGALSWNITVIKIFPELMDSIHSVFFKTDWQLINHRSGVPTDVKNRCLYYDKNLIYVDC